MFGHAYSSLLQNRLGDVYDGQTELPDQFSVSSKVTSTFISEERPRS